MYVFALLESQLYFSVTSQDVVDRVCKIDITCISPCVSGIHFHLV